MLLKLLTKLGYRTDEEVREEYTKRLKEEITQNQKNWEEKLKDISDSERLEVIEAIVKYETDLTKIREKILKVLNSRNKEVYSEEEDYKGPFDDWFWDPSYPRSIFHYPWHEHK